MSNSKVKNSPGNSFAIFSIAIVLYVLIVYLAISFHSRYLNDYFREQVAFVIELDSNQDETKEILQFLKSQNEIITEKVRLVNPDEARKLMNAEIRSELVNLNENPFKPLIIFHLKSKFYDGKLINKLSEQIKEMDHVAGFYFQEELFGNLHKNLRKINLVLLAFVSVLALMMFLVIINTIRFKLQNNRFQIKTMELVGAEPNYINRIYQKQALSIGFNAVLVAILLFILSIVVIYLKYDKIIEFLDVKWLVLSVLIASLIGLCLIGLTTKIQINKYLSKHFYELYH